MTDQSPGVGQITTWLDPKAAPETGLSGFTLRYPLI